MRKKNLAKKYYFFMEKFDFHFFVTNKFWSKKCWFFGRYFFDQKRFRTKDFFDTFFDEKILDFFFEIKFLREKIIFGQVQKRFINREIKRFHSPTKNIFVPDEKLLFSRRNLISKKSRIFLIEKNRKIPKNPWS